MNIVEHMSLWYDWASYGYILGIYMVLLGLEEGCFLIFWEMSKIKILNKFLANRIEIHKKPTLNGHIMWFHFQNDKIIEAQRKLVVAGDKACGNVGWKEECEILEDEIAWVLTNFPHDLCLW